jgi:hypothetical protein
MEKSGESFRWDETLYEAVDVETTVAEFKALLKAGTEKVYWEGHLLGVIRRHRKSRQRQVPG